MTMFSNRLAGHKVHVMSHKKKKSNITGYAGVSKSGSRRYTARLTIEGKYSSLGTFDSPREAAIAYDRAVIKHNLPLYKLNFPNGAAILNVPNGLAIGDEACNKVLSSDRPKQLKFPNRSLCVPTNDSYDQQRSQKRTSPSNSSTVIKKVKTSSSSSSSSVSGHFGNKKNYMFSPIRDVNVPLHQRKTNFNARYASIDSRSLPEHEFNAMVVVLKEIRKQDPLFMRCLCGVKPHATTSSQERIHCQDVNTRKLKAKKVIEASNILMPTVHATKTMAKFTPQIHIKKEVYEFVGQGNCKKCCDALMIWCRYLQIAGGCTLREKKSTINACGKRPRESCKMITAEKVLLAKKSLICLGQPSSFYVDWAAKLVPRFTEELGGDALMVNATRLFFDTALMLELPTMLQACYTKAPTNGYDANYNYSSLCQSASNEGSSSGGGGGGGGGDSGGGGGDSGGGGGGSSFSHLPKTTAGMFAPNPTTPGGSATSVGSTTSVGSSVGSSTLSTIADAAAALTYLGTRRRSYYASPEEAGLAYDRAVIKYKRTSTFNFNDNHTTKSGGEKQSRHNPLYVYRMSDFDEEEDY